METELTFLSLNQLDKVSSFFGLGRESSLKVRNSEPWSQRQFPFRQAKPASATPASLGAERVNSASFLNCPFSSCKTVRRGVSLPVRAAIHLPASASKSKNPMFAPAGGERSPNCA